MSLTNSPTASLAKKSYAGIATTAISYGMLLLLFGFWHFTRQTGPNWPVFLLQCLPLLLLLPGLLQKHYRSYSWLSFLMLVYFVKAVDGALMSTARWSDYLFLLLTITIFVAAMLASRWLQRLTKA